MGVTKLIPNYTYRDYLNWEGRWELIEGIPFAMRPMPTPKHQRIASNLNIQIGTQLMSNNCSCKVYHPIDVKINQQTVVNPDLLIVCDDIEGHFLERPFPFAVEILSPSTKVKDEVSKFNLYQEFGVKYYLIINPETDTYVVYQLGKNGVYLEHNSSDFIIDENCKISLDLQSIFS